MLDQKSEQIHELNTHERKLNTELQKAKEAISKLESNVSIAEKERSKESKLRKEDQSRLIELVEQKQKLESRNEYQKAQLEESNKDIDELKYKLNQLDQTAEDYKEEVQNMRSTLGSHIDKSKDQIQELTDVVEAKSATIQDYEARL